jgi:AraC-like DNA-binding protein
MVKSAKHTRMMIFGREISLPFVDHMGVNAYAHSVGLSDHEHAGYEMVFVVGGELSYRVSGGEVYRVKSGHYSFMPPRVRHHPLVSNDGPCVSCWIVFDPYTIDAAKNTPFDGGDLESMGQVLVGHGTSVQPYGTSTRHTLHSFRMALMDYYSPEPSVASVAMLRSLGAKLVIDGVQQLQSATIATESMLGEAAIAYIRAHLFERVSVPDIAAHLGFSVSRTYSLFREHTGQSPVDYIVRLRVEAAEKLLEDHSLSVAEISARCGFSSSQYFARTFRKYSGLSPSAYRDRLRRRG